MSSNDKPTAAFVLSLIGGIFVLLAGFIIGVIGAIATFFIAGIGGVFGLLGMLWGILMIIGAVMLYRSPDQHTEWGIVILVASLGIIWHPETISRPLATRICPYCGRVLRKESKFCQHCGKQLP
jgi:hypothetical protein